MDSPGLDGGDGALDHLADPADAPVGLLGGLAQFAVGGLLVRSDHLLADVALVGDPSGGVQPQGVPQPQARRIPLDALLAQTDEQIGELGGGQPRGIINDDDPFLMRSSTILTSYYTSWRQIITISFPGNARRHPLNRLL